METSAKKFTCDRCGATTYVELTGYEKESGCPAYPNHWASVKGFDLCESCYESFKEWMASRK